MGENRLFYDRFSAHFPADPLKFLFAESLLPARTRHDHALGRVARLDAFHGEPSRGVISTHTKPQEIASLNSMSVNFYLSHWHCSILSLFPQINRKLFLKLFPSKLHYA